MTKFTFTPEKYHVFNEFDKHGLSVALPRIKDEGNVSYKQRILDVFVNRADSTHRGLINGITRELGLNIIDCMQVVPTVDGNGDTLLDMPAVVFDETKCILYSDFVAGTVLLTLDRFDLGGGSWDINSLAGKIDATGFFVTTILEDADDAARSMTIFNQSSVKLVTREEIDTKGVRIHLENRNLISGTISIQSASLSRRVDAELDLNKAGDYFLDLPNGILVTVGAPEPGSAIRYQYRDDEFIAQSSPVIMHNLQSDDFKTKMFEQVTGPDGDTADGRPTSLGADIINELLSVFPSTWGE